MAKSHPRKRVELSQGQARLIQLSWKLLEHKLMYYSPEKVHSDWHSELTITDIHYDSLEQEFKALGGKPHVDFPSSRPCGELVLSKLSVAKNTKKV